MKARRPFVGWVLLFPAIVGLPIAWHHHLFPLDTWLLAGLGILGAAWTFPVLEPLFAPPARAPRPSGGAPYARWGWGGIVLGSGLVLGAVYLLWHRPHEWHLPLYMWTGGLAVLVLSGYALGFQPPVEEEGRGMSLPLRWEVGGVLLLLLVGVGLRVYRLDRIPPGIFVDETNAAGDALRLLSGWPGSPFGVGWYETPLLYVYYMAGVFKVLGTSYYALKVASLIPAVLTLVLFYPFVREMFGPFVAWVALAFFVFSRWHLILSRWGWNELAPPLFYMGSLWLLLRGARTGRRGHFLLAGVLLGLGMYTYLASRLMALAVFLYLVYRGVVDRKFLQRAWAGVALFFLAYTLTFAPLATTYVKDPFTFLNRSKQVSILNDMRARYRPEHPLPAPLARALRVVGLPTDISLEPLWESGVKHVRMFFVEGDRNPRHNIPGAPVLDPLTAALFLVGWGYALFRWKDHRRGLLLIGVVVPLLGGVLSLAGEAPQAYRTLGVLPAVCALAGDTLVRLGAAPYVLLSGWRREERKPLFPSWASVGLVGGGLLVVALVNTRAFFHTWAHDPRVWIAFSPMETAVAREVQANLSGHRIYLSPTLYWGSPLRFLTYGRSAEYRMIQPVEDLPLTDEVDENTLFILEPLYKDLLELFTEYYPHTQAELVQGVWGLPLFLRVRIPRSDIEAIRGLRLTCQGGDGHTLREDVVREWGRSCPSADRGVWEGSVFFPRSTVYDMRVLPHGRIWVDAVPWRGPRRVGRGLHALRVVVDAPPPGGIHLEWQGMGSPWRTVPFTHLFLVPPPQHGLWGTYYQGEGWKGVPLFSRVDRTLLFAWADPEPVVGPFSVIWRGALFVPRDGEYRLRVAADDGVRLWVDGQVAAESLRPDTMNEVDVHVRLSRGFHPVRVDYFQRGGAKTITFFWQPPGERERIVPPSYLRPDGRRPLHTGN